jgi:hypothetical protein
VNKREQRIARKLASETPADVQVASETPADVQVASETPADVQVASETPADVQVATMGKARTYTFLRLHHQLGAEEHASYSACRGGVVYIPTAMLAVPPVAGDTLTLAVSTVVVPQHTLTFSAITGNDARRRYTVQGHKGRVVIHAAQLPQGANEPHAYLYCSTLLALAPGSAVKHVRDTVSEVAAVAMRIAQAAGRALPTDDDLQAAKVAVGV